MHRKSEYPSWTIQVRGVPSTNLGIGRLVVQDECFVSANTRLCDFFHSVCLSTEVLANEFRDALVPVMSKRYGEAIELQVVDRGPQGRPEFDDAIVRARLEQKMFAPNRKPIP